MLRIAAPIAVAALGAAGLYFVFLRDEAPEAPAPAAVVVTAPIRPAPERAPEPPPESVPGHPWLRKLPGVHHATPEQVPDVLYRKYQSFDETWERVQEGGGSFTADGYEVHHLDEGSLLSTRAGLRPGDRIISVNGQPVRASLGAGKALFEQLKNERRFTVLVERDGHPITLEFQVP